MRQVEYEEVRLPLHAADHHHRLAEIGGMSLAVLKFARQALLVD